MGSSKNPFIWVLIVCFSSLLIVTFGCFYGYYTNELLIFVLGILFVIMDSVFIGIFLVKAIACHNYLRLRKEFQDKCKEFACKVENGEFDNDNPFKEFDDGKEE